MTDMTEIPQTFIIMRCVVCNTHLPIFMVNDAIRGQRSYLSGVSAKLECCICAQCTNVLSELIMIHVLEIYTV